MSDWQQVNVRVKERTYEEWKEVAEAEYGGISDLVRTAVRREIDGHHSGGEQGASDETLSEVAEVVDSLENTVRDMDKRLTAVQSTVESSGPGISLKAAVRETLQTPQDGDTVAEYGMMAPQVAARLDGDTEEVREALETLFEQDPNVVFSEESGNEYYFRRRRDQ